jgi:hypothetical protein
MRWIRTANVSCILTPFLPSHINTCFIVYSLLPFHRLSLTFCTYICVLLGYDAASLRNWFQTFRNNVVVSFFRVVRSTRSFSFKKRSARRGMYCISRKKLFWRWCIATVNYRENTNTKSALDKGKFTLSHSSLDHARKHFNTSELGIFKRIRKTTTNRKVAQTSTTRLSKILIPANQQTKTEKRTTTTTTLENCTQYQSSHMNCFCITSFFIPSPVYVQYISVIKKSLRLLPLQVWINGRVICEKLKPRTAFVFFPPCNQTAAIRTLKGRFKTFLN